MKEKIPRAALLFSFSPPRSCAAPLPEITIHDYFQKISEVKPEHPSATAPSRSSPRVGASWRPAPTDLLEDTWSGLHLTTSFNTLQSNIWFFTALSLSFRWGVQRKAVKGGHQCFDPSIQSASMLSLFCLIKPLVGCQPQTLKTTQSIEWETFAERDISKQGNWVLLRRVRMMLPEGDTRFSRCELSLPSCTSVLFISPLVCISCIFLIFFRTLSFAFYPVSFLCSVHCSSHRYFFIV